MPDSKEELPLLPPPDSAKRKWDDFDESSTRPSKGKLAVIEYPYECDSLTSCEKAQIQKYLEEKIIFKARLYMQSSPSDSLVQALLLYALHDRNLPIFRLLMKDPSIDLNGKTKCGLSLINCIANLGYHEFLNLVLNDPRCDRSTFNPAIEPSSLHNLNSLAALLYSSHI
jgi:hypothetical protein